MIRLQIPEATPSLNTGRKHWSYHTKLRKHWSQLVMEAKFKNRFETHPTPQHARVTVTRYGKRMLDRDNFVGGLKNLIDGLKDNGLILDDDASHMTLEAEQKTLVKGDKPSTLVVITELPCST
jgi:hypothetical protein